jgi:cell division topological specificity factor
MNVLPFFRRRSAPVARERLQILLAHERLACSQPDLLGILHKEILVVIGRRISFESDKVQIKMDRGNIRVNTRS